jgi:hypothetical protein
MLRPNGPELSCGNVPLDYRSSSRVVVMRLVVIY